MHPNYIDEQVRREQIQDWQRLWEQEQLARRLPLQPGLRHAVVKWFRIVFKRPPYSTIMTRETRSTLALKR